MPDPVCRSTPRRWQNTAISSIFPSAIPILQPTDEAIIEKAYLDAKAGHTHYGDPKGDPELIAAVCKAWQEDFSQALTPDHVLVTASSCLGMALTMLAILNPGDEVIVFSPYFAMYRSQIELAGGVCVDVPTYACENYAISEERLRAAITPKTKAIIFNNPTNPTGMAYGRETLELLAKIAQEYDLLVAADEIYTTYLYEGDYIPLRTLPGMLERTITLNSFSKNFLMTGWRVGVIIAEPALLCVMNQVNGALIYSAPSISQRAAIAALENRAHILVSPGDVFGIAGKQHFRIACTVNIDKLREAYDRMEALSF